MKLHLIASALFAFGMASAANADVSLLDLSPLYKDVDNNGTMEVVHPYIVGVDANTMRFRFDVYPIDSNVKLFSTYARDVAYPAMPCTNPVWTDQTFNAIKFLGANVSRSHVAFGMMAECQESTGEWKEAYRTFVYSAAVDAEGGAVWTKVYNLNLLSFEGINVDADPTNELVLTMTIDLTTLPNPDSGNTRTIAFDGANGAVVFDKTRALIR